MTDDAASGTTMARIRLQVMWDRLISVVEEQAQTLVRIGFSTSTREAGDVSAGVFDARGRMLAQAVTGTPGHVNSMARAVVHFIAAFPTATMAPGDVFITNDPWKGTGHLHDFTVVTPVFRRGALVALFACTCHVIDVGGRGMGPEARNVLEEGIFIPIRRLATAAGVDQTLIDLIHSNVREPIQVVGDIYSLQGCNDVGARRLVRMMDEFDLATLDELGEHILHHSREAMLRAIQAMPRGTWHNRMRIDGYDEPLDLVAAMTIDGQTIAVDFTGTSPPSGYGINVPFCYTEAYSSFGIKCIVAPRVPNNEGSLSLIRISAPPDCIVNAQWPLPVAARHITGQMLPDVVIGCLGQALGGQVPAEGTSCLWNLQAQGGPGAVNVPPIEVARARAFNVMSFHSGGTGARPGKDGLSATAFPSGVRNVSLPGLAFAGPPQRIPHRQWRRRTAPRRAWPGDGGISLDDASYTLSANYDRVLFPPRGRDGGANGAAGTLTLASGRTLNGKGRQTIPRGDTLFIHMPGGGGLGDPFLRDPDLVARDVGAGLVSAAAARQAYGVVLQADGALDRDATASVRNNREFL